MHEDVGEGLRHGVLFGCGIIPCHVGWAITREDVSPLQGLGFLRHDTRAFSPGYHMAGLRPF
jgi:hypothetical protein